MRRPSWSTVLLAAVPFAFLAAAFTFAFTIWQRTVAQMSIHGWIAVGQGVVMSVAVGCGLMALVFCNNRRGYGEPPSVGDRVSLRLAQRGVTQI